MKIYQIIMSTEYIIEADSEEEALDMIDYSCEVETYCESIEVLKEIEK